MFMKHTIRALSLATAIAVTTAGPASASLRIDSGETIHATLTSAVINTKNAHVGDPFTMQMGPPYPGRHISLDGGTIYGHVSEVRSGGQGRKAKLKLAFDRLRLPNGESSPLRGTVTKLDRTPENTTARKGLGAGVGAAVGSQTIGRILGGTLGAVVGIVGGAAGGYLYGSNDKPNFNVGSGSAVTITTDATAVVTRRQAR
jgi:hypothetical protein